MARVPVVGRLFWTEYIALLLSFFFLFLEVPVRIITLLLPQPVIRWFYNRSKNLFNGLSSQNSIRARSKRRSISHPIASASDFTEICALFGYSTEEHVVQTADGYLLGCHRLPYKRGEEQDGALVNAGPGSVQKPVVYFHHGLLMNSEVWVCITEEERCLPFALVEQGYDVWLGNNRGNKYSKKSTRFSPATTDFWNFSMDQFAFHDIPDSIDYILRTTSQPSLSYIGFSQGTAQAFAALSIHPPLNQKINLFVALAPAMSPAGLSNGIVDSLVKASPDVLFLAFGRKSMLSSATFWQSILYPPIFVRLIDMSLSFLFAWSCCNISPHQKLAAYPHLYSFTSTKSVVHWFQIIRNKSFQMYDDDSSHALSIGASDRYYKVAKFPTRNIKTPIALVYGGSDSLVDIRTMLRELPKHTLAFEIPHFEHLDFLWAQDVHKLVFPHVFNALRHFSQTDRSNRNGLPSTVSLAFAHANTARLRSRTGSTSEEDPSVSDYDGALDTPTPSRIRKSSAQVARDEQYMPIQPDDSPLSPDLPSLPWESNRPHTRKNHANRVPSPLDPAVERTIIRDKDPNQWQIENPPSSRPTPHEPNPARSITPVSRSSVDSQPREHESTHLIASNASSDSNPPQPPKIGAHKIRLAPARASVSLSGVGFASDSDGERERIGRERQRERS